MSDKDYIWFPFMFLKPKPKSFITQKRMLAMAFCFGSYGALVYMLKQVFFEDQSLAMTVKDLVQNIILISLAFWVWFQLVTSRLWNLRAEYLIKISQQE